MNSKPGNVLLVRSIIFLVLGVFFLVYAMQMEPSSWRTIFYVFAGIDIIWAAMLLMAILRNKRNN